MPLGYSHQLYRSKLRNQSSTAAIYESPPRKTCRSAQPKQMGQADESNKSRYDSIALVPQTLSESPFEFLNRLRSHIVTGRGMPKELTPRLEQSVSQRIEMPVSNANLLTSEDIKSILKKSPSKTKKNISRSKSSMFASAEKQSLNDQYECKENDYGESPVFSNKKFAACKKAFAYDPSQTPSVPSQKRVKIVQSDCYQPFQESTTHFLKDVLMHPTRDEDLDTQIPVLQQQSSNTTSSSYESNYSLVNGQQVSGNSPNKRQSKKRKLAQMKNTDQEIVDELDCLPDCKRRLDFGSEPYRRPRLTFNNVVEVYLFPKDNSDLKLVNDCVKELPKESTSKA